MISSEPSATVNVISVMLEGGSFESLLRVPIMPGMCWVEEVVTVGDCQLVPATPIFSRFDPDGFGEYVKSLDVVADDGLENLKIIGGDGDGHTYLVGTRTGSFFVLWHDPDEFERLASSLAEFLQWMIRERSDHLEGCPWELFVTSSGSLRPICAIAWRRERIKPAIISVEAKKRLPWTHEYTCPVGFELLNKDLGFGLRFKDEHRGHNSHLRMIADRQTVAREALENFWNWVVTQGFGTE